MPRPEFQRLDRKITWLIGGMALGLFFFVALTAGLNDFTSCKRQVAPRKATIERQRLADQFYSDLATNVRDRARREAAEVRRIRRVGHVGPAAAALMKYLRRAAAADRGDAKGYAKFGREISAVVVEPPNCFRVPPGT